MNQSRPVKVYVKRVNKKFVLSWTYDGREHMHRLRVKTRREAERAAIDKEAEIAGQQSAVAWHVVCTEYEEFHENSSVGYQKQIVSCLNKISKLSPIDWTWQVDQAWATDVCAKIAAAMESPSSVSSYLKVLRAFLNWGRQMNHWESISVKVPGIDPDEAARGEAISLEQFHEILDAVGLVVEGARTRSWVDLLWGYWLTGFRLSELLSLTWDDISQIHIVDLDRYPEVRFPRGKSKGTKRKHDRWAIPPDCAAFLKTLPRHGSYVFRPLTPDLARYRCPCTVGKIISRITTKSGVYVQAYDGSMRPASAQDLRRSFAARWYELTRDPELVAKLCRHKSFSTTRRFYNKQSFEVLSQKLGGFDV